MKILFQPGNKPVEAKEGMNLLKIAESAGILIDAACGGTGKCGKCKVKIVSGDAGELTSAEKTYLSEYEITHGYRLACQVMPPESSSLEVIIPGQHGGSDRKTQMTRMPESFRPESRIKALHGVVRQATITNQKSDIERIAATFHMPGMKIVSGVLPRVHNALNVKHGDVTAVFRSDVLMHIENGDSSSKCYGAAFDIGTTTVVGMLWDLSANELVDIEARTNYQTAYGSDVISRISYSMSARDHLHNMQEKVIQCFNDILETMYLRNGITYQNVYEVTAVGNTTMSHFVLGVDASSMSRIPFAPVFREAQQVPARSLNIQVNPQARFYLLPNIAGHVGSDITGVILAVDMDHLTGSHIALDIGTNGEVVAIKDGKMVCCSTAAGPAFEGATIHFGMRAAPGAIESVRITKDGDVVIKTIDDKPAIGICGSGVIDAVAQMLDAGIVDNNGHMLFAKGVRDAGLGDSLASHITICDDKPALILAVTEEGEEIVVTQDDVREIQLAKGAILGGILTLMKTLGIQKNELDSILLAGAFGNYIKKESALRIGLLPQVPIGKIISVGNAAGAGSSMALLSDAVREHASQVASEIEHVELSMNNDFKNFYMTTMSFDRNMDYD